jgi:hypothetical protein
LKIEKTTIKGWIEAAREARVLGAEGLDLTTAASEAAAALLYPQSLKQRKSAAVTL